MIINNKTIPYRFLILIGSAIVILSSCLNQDSTPPTLSIQSPMSQQSFSAATDSIPIIFTAEDNKTIELARVTLQNANGAILFSDTKHVHHASLIYHTSYIISNNIITPTELRLKVEILDHANNSAISSLDLIVLQ